jgi:hypothetical protein
MQHLDEGTIHAWLDGALPADEAASVAGHVAQCRPCAAMVAEARGMIAAAGNIVSSLDGVRGGVIPISKPAVAGQGSLWRLLRLTPGRAALAATLLVAVASLLTLRKGSEPRVSRAEPVTAIQLPAAGRAATDQSIPSKAVDKITTATPTPATTIATQRQELSDRNAQRPVNSVAAKPAQIAASDSSASADSAAKNVANPVVVARGLARDAAAASAPPRAGVAGSFDATRAQVATAAVSGDSRATNAERRFAAAPRLQEITVTGAIAAKSRSDVGELEGCYQIRPDSASSVAAGFPTRFALVNAGGAAPYVVRSVSPEGRVDSIIPGGSWQRMTPDVVRVQFANARAQQPLALQLAPTAGARQAIVGGPAAVLQVTPIDCRP